MLIAKGTFCSTATTNISWPQSSAGTEHQGSKCLPPGQERQVWYPGTANCVCYLWSNSLPTKPAQFPQHELLNSTTSVSAKFSHGFANKCTNNRHRTWLAAKVPPKPDWWSYGYDTTFLYSTFLYSFLCPSWAATLPCRWRVSADRA